MDQESNSISRRPWQFSLKGMLIAVVLLGFACAAAKFALWRGPGEDAHPNAKHILSVHSIPILLAGSVGALRERITRWIGYGLLVDLVIICVTVFVGARLQ